MPHFAKKLLCRGSSKTLRCNSPFLVTYPSNPIKKIQSIPQSGSVYIWQSTVIISDLCSEPGLITSLHHQKPWFILAPRFTNSPNSGSGYSLQIPVRSKTSIVCIIIDHKNRFKLSNSVENLNTYGEVSPCHVGFLKNATTHEKVISPPHSKLTGSEKSMHCPHLHLTGVYFIS